jgi:predicted CXXCH cytochrome family protein
MKRIIVVAVALAFVLLSAGSALAVISGSKHDMRTHLTAGSFNGGYDEVCVYCHTPHSSSMAAQLWNHTGTSAVFTPYTSATMNVAPSVTPGPGSLLCLSCHDGTQAVDTLVNPPNVGTPGTNLVTGNLNAAKKLAAGSALMGTDLTNDHPVGFTYGGGTESVEITAGTLKSLVTVQGYTSVRLIGGTQVECATCHDAHNQTYAPFLRSTNQGSQLCLACHIK